MTDSPEPDLSAEEDAELVARERSYYLALLREIPVDRARLDERERERVRYPRSVGIGWDEIAAALGIGSGGDAAREYFGEPEPGEAPFLQDPRRPGG